MSDNITISVPSNDTRALIAGATMLLTLAGKLPICELPDTKPDAGDKPLKVEKKVGLHAVPDAEDLPPIPDISEANATLEAGLEKIPVDEEIPAIPGSEEIPAIPAAEETAAPDVQLDMEGKGIPWDSRIHAGTKTFTVNGAWKRKRGVAKELIETVEQELRDLMATPAAETTLAAVADSDAPTTFPKFLKAVSELIAAEKTTLDKVEAILHLPAHNVRTMAALAARPDMIPQVWAAVLKDE